jgi:nitroreductase
MSTTRNSELDVAAVVDAASRAPSVHATQPWLLDPRSDGVDLIERFDVQLPYHDPHNRDRSISCGAALANVLVAIQAQGLAGRVELLPDENRPELAARVTGSGTSQPSAADLALHAAVFRRHSHRAPFSILGPALRDRDALVTAMDGNGVTARVVRRPEVTALADLIDYAELALRDDPAYQRELTAYLPDFPELVEPGSSLPWSGLVRADTAVPDRFVLADRLGRELLLFIVGDTDDRRGHLLAGMALERGWLTAVSHGLAASVITQLWQLPEVRDRLTELLGDNGFPHAMLRVGRPPTDREWSVPTQRTSGWS